MGKQCTPPPKELTTPDTIPKLKQTSLAAYCSGDLTLGRMAVLRDLGEIPSMLLDYFKSATLPPLHEQININKVKESLQHDAALNQWAGFAKEPKDSQLSEDMMFKPLSNVFEAVSNATCPDAYLLLLEKKSVDAQKAKKDHAKNSNPDLWDDIMVSFEFKKGNGNVECKDEPEHLIYFFSSLMFASDHELGWDPTIWRVCIKGTPQYDITTMRIISDFNADALRGCGTCIFEVCPKSPDGKQIKGAEPNMLKDCWRNSNQDCEDTILEKMFTDLKDQKGIKQANEARKYFLTVLAAGNVMVDNKIDGTDSLLCMSDLPVDCKTAQDRQRTHSKFPLHSLFHQAVESSSQNPLLFGLQGADLEYAKHMNSKTVHEVQMGMLEFMACEVIVQEYLFALDNDISNDDEWNEDIEINKHLKVDEDAEIPFKFNPLHDMESIWWIQVWTLYYHVNQEGRQLSSGKLTLQVKKACCQPTMMHYIAKLHSVFTKHLVLTVKLSRGVPLFCLSAKHPQQEDSTSKTQDSKQPKV
ncbi:hypothetical protein EDC04DRAFT_2611445 [Pisolithus marmoratus]|nr:hypothetical protein EDC04DRAFT_2611445 [Pisolithus marmoratus]